ncbi:MAG TPA: pantetheine-phosphate adenylyltransferase [Dehalococcoidia bacterium]|nr:pantetheine-phosphate adenylyltransferase [Dehalococcoidia bacterium]
MTIAMFPGRFDPVTNGHRDIARRSARLFERVIVAVADLRQNYLFTTAERVAFIEEAVKDCPNIQVMSYSGLTVDFAREQGATVMVRSMRAVTDFEAEFDMALMNKKMQPGIESVYLMASLEHLFISGTRIREVSALGYDVSDLVPPHVSAALKKKHAEREGSR